MNALPPGRHDGDRPGARQGLQRARRCCARRCGARDFRRKRRALRRDEPRHRPRALLPRLRASPAAARSSSRRRPALELTRDGRADPRRPRRRSARARAPCTRRSSRTTLGIPYERVEVADADTARVPDSGPTVASRTCMVVGKILESCALRDEGAAREDCRRREYLAEHGPLVVTTRVRAAARASRWSDETYQGDAYGAYGWGCNVAEVELDPVTGEIRPLQRHRRAATSARRSTRSSPRGRSRAARRRGSAGRSSRRSSMKRRPHGERAAHELHRPDDARHAADRRRRSSRTRTRTARSAPRASARCRSTGRRRRS